MIDQYNKKEDQLKSEEVQLVSQKNILHGTNSVSRLAWDSHEHVGLHGTHRAR